MDRAVSRREALRAIGGSLGAVTLGGVAGAEQGPPERHVVGTASPAAERAAQARADAVHRVLDFGDLGRAVTARFPEAARSALEARADVRYVEPDAPVDALAQSLPWGVDRVDADAVHDANETGEGADVAIVDTGIDSDHPDLQANLGAGEAFVSCDAGGDTCRTAWDDDNGHGTHCAGIADATDNDRGVVGVSTSATLHAVKVLDENGSGTVSDVAAGIEHVAKQGWDVASMSLGASSGSQTLHDACTYAYGEGVLLVAAAGNDGPCSDCVGYPAAYEEVVAVSATDQHDALAEFSSTGPAVELAAPGVSITSTVPGGYDAYSGTSMACPHAAGAGAQLMADGYANTEVRDRLAATAEDVGLASNESGAGLLDVATALDDGATENAAPTVSWNAPSDGATVAGDVTLDVSASDDGSVAAVEWRRSDAAWTTMTDADGNGTYDDTWDSSAVADGTYALDARATDDAGATATASVSVTVDNEEDTSSAPSVDRHAVTEAGSPNPHLEVTVDWAASDADGDLATVTVSAEDADGSAFGDVHRYEVGGSDVAGSDEFSFKHARNETAAVAVEVTDAAGNTAAHSEQVTE